MKIDELRKHLKIDKNNLDEVIQLQPELYYIVAQKHVLAVSERDLAYDEIKIVDAKLQKEVREQAEAEGRKMTEKAVEIEVLSNKLHTDAIDMHLRTKYTADELGALRESFQQKSYMLRELVELYVSGYFSDDSLTVKQDGSSRIARKRKVS